MVVLVGLCSFAHPESSGDEISFSLDVQPILAEFCLQCHGPDEQQRQADLRLDMPTDHDTAIVAGKPDESEVIERLLTDDDDLQMPPTEMEKRPSEEQIQTLRDWIASGAPYERHWSYQPIRDPKVPAIDAGQSPIQAKSDIDRFVIAALQSKGLMLSQPASRRQLIRRASVDLLGLPPTPDEVAAFVNDPDEDAFAEAIDKMLESPRYGERWGRHWLDVARYADTHGGSAIGFTRFAFSYTYRDYVINAFNKDLPYDQFLLQQLAADQIGLDDNDPSLAALGFLTGGMQFRSVHDLIDDQIDVVTRGLLGMTVACARCHDHKFDAIPTSDYYALYATLAASRRPERLPVLGQPPVTDALRDYQQELSKRQTVYRDMARDQSEVMRSRLRNQVGMYLTEIAKGTPEQDVSAAFLSYRTDDIRPIIYNRWRDYLAAISADDPVFGPWVRLSAVGSDQFVPTRDQLLETLKTENGDPSKFAKTHQLAVTAPRWNPRVIAAIEGSQPKNLIELAAAYGDLFATVHLDWLGELLNASRQALEDEKILTDEDPAHAVINSAIDQQLRRHLYEPGTPTAVSDEIAVKLLNRTVKDNLNGKRSSIHELHLTSPGSPPRGMVLRESDDPPTFYVFRRGNSLSCGDSVQPHFLTAITSSQPVPYKDGRRRLGLAKSIIAPENPLTRRVIVNWIWRNHFGLGIVRTPDDFGTRGTPPTHPELLDYLATIFAQDGWSIKQMHRRIMLSAVYQQAAIENLDAREVDPDNRLLWRMPRRRLEMEAMRDAMLAVSGELNTTMIGGRPFDFESDPIVPRRSIYGFINRDVISNLASSFDAADPTSCTVKRPQTTVPQQALFALNSAFIQDRAAKVANLALSVSDRDRDRIQWLYERLYSRPPVDDEMRLSLEFVRANASDSGKSEATNRWAQLAHALLASNEFHFVD